MLIAMCFTYNSGNYIYFGFPYLTFKQEYECRHDASALFTDCDIEEVICPAREQSLADFEYRVNIDADYYLNNWFVEMDLMCESKVRTNIMVSARYIAFGIAGALLFAVPDRWGRKKSLLLAATVNTMTQFAIIFVPIYELRLLGHIFMGLVMLKQAVPFVWGAELLPPSRGTISSVCLTSFDAMTLLISCLYYMFISREVVPLLLTTTVLAAAALLFLFAFVPESPQWLLS